MRKLYSLLIFMIIINLVYSTENIYPLSLNVNRNDLLLEENKKYNNEKLENNASLLIPTLFITYGAMSHFYKPIKDFDYSLKNSINTDKFQNHKIDDSLMFMPYIANYRLESLGYVSKNTKTDKMLASLTSLGILAMIVDPLKKSTGRMRPNGNDKLSFPSGHSSFAFAGAHMLYKEYKDTDALIPIFGYSIASLTAGFRIAKNRHWLSDVVAGAGFGMLSVELGYYLSPKLKKYISLEDENIEFIPIITKDRYGVSIEYKF